MYAAVIESEPVRRRSRLLPGSPAGLSSATVCPVIEEPYTCEVRGGAFAVVSQHGHALPSMRESRREHAINPL